MLVLVAFHDGVASTRCFSLLVTCTNILNCQTIQTQHTIIIDAIQAHNLKYNSWINQL